VSKPTAHRTVMPPSWIAAALVILTAVAGIGSEALRDHALSKTAKPISAVRRTAAVGAEERGRVRRSLDALPLAFEVNQGQTDPRIKYTAQAGGYTLFLTADDVVFALRSLAQPAEQATPKHSRARAAEVTSQASKRERRAAIRMRLLGGNPRAHVAAGNQLPGRTNYFIGNDPGKWHAHVPRYARVSYRDVYPGVSMAFYGLQRKLEFDFIVTPGASPALIRLGVSGANGITIDDTGNLLLSSSAGDVLLHKPVAYQEKEDARYPVEARFVVTAGNQVGFQLGDYDRTRQLVIDPSVSYATYLGGTLEDDGNAIAIDSSGNAYVTGQTTSLNFPIVPGSYRTTNAGGLDVFVTKISADGSTLIYSTYVGGSGSDGGNAIAVDASGNAFVAGVTASATDFPTTSGALQTTFGGGDLDAFVFELSPAGAKLTYSTYLGGNGVDVASGLALDGSGNAYIVGSTTSTNFPTHDAIQSSIAGQSNGFVTKLNASGNALVYSTYLGGGTGDFAAAVAVDASNQTYVTGATQNPTFPTTANAFQRTCGSDGTCNGGLDDAFVTVFKADGSGFVYSTFLGGESADQGYGIALDSAGDAYVTGATLSNDFPLKSPIQNTYGGNQDAFVAALNPAGSALLYSTYLGGSLNETGTGIAVDGANNVYVTGQTGSSNFPTANPTQQNLGGDDDAFVTVINSAGSQFLFSTYLGGSLEENSAISISDGTVIAIGAIAVDKAGVNIYVTGNTFSTDFPTRSAHQPSNAGPGYADAFIARYAQANFTVAAAPLSPPSINPGASATSAISVVAVNGFSSSVALTCSVSPATAHPPTCGLSPASVNPGTPSTLTVTTTAATTAANYTVTVTGTSGGFVHTAIASLSVQDFSISASPLSPAAVNPGASATSTVTVSALNGFGAPVSLTCSVSPSLPNSPTCGFSLTPVVPGGTSTLTVTSSTSTLGAIYTVVVTGTWDADVHSTTVNLTVNGFLISATTPTAVNAGSSATSAVTLTALNGYSLPVKLTCSVTGAGSPLPACSATGFSTNPVTPTGAGAQTMLTITTTSPVNAMRRHASTLSPPLWFPAMGISLLGMSCVAARGRRKKLVAVALLGFILTALLLLPACGGNNGPGRCSAAPNAPTALAASATTSTGTTLNWTAPTSIGTGNCGLINYTIYQNGASIGTNAASSFIVTGLSPSTTYMFTVAASDNAGMGPQSSPLSVTTGSGATPPGSYTITITGTDANNLSNSTQVTLTVN
jgi:fibronectin type III domain protein/beta-propeller repeat-containing protein